MRQPAAEDEDDDRDAALVRQIALARRRPDGALREPLLLGRLLARHEPNIRRMVSWRAHSQQPSKADIDEIVNSVLIGAAEDIDKVLAGQVAFGAVIGRKVEDEVVEWVRRRKRRAGDVAIDDKLDELGVEDSPSLVREAEELRARVAELPERDQAFLAERMFGGLRPKQIAERHGVHRRVLDTATSRALKKLLASDALADERDVRDRSHPSGNET